MFPHLHKTLCHLNLTQTAFPCVLWPYPSYIDLNTPCSTPLFQLFFDLVHMLSSLLHLKQTSNFITLSQLKSTKHACHVPFSGPTGPSGTTCHLEPGPLPQNDIWSLSACSSPACYLHNPASSVSSASVTPPQLSPCAKMIVFGIVLLSPSTCLAGPEGVVHLWCPEKQVCHWSCWWVWFLNQRAGLVALMDREFK